MANNPYVNKVQFGNQTLIDLTSDTITADKLMQGYTAHDRTGALITGTATGQSLVITDTVDEHGGTIRTITGKVVELKTKNITSNGTFSAEDDDADGYTSVTVNVSGDAPAIQSLSVTPSGSQQIFNASSVDGYKPVTVNAMPSGTAGTPTATKGTVSNHSVSVTPSVTNQTGYITGSTKTGTAVTVSASELVSGTLSLTDNGTSNCTNYASVNVNIPFVTYYTGTTDPSSSLGSNGDIYLKTV